MSITFIQTGIESQDVQTLLHELNETLVSILGHNGMAHVCMNDFNGDKAFFLVRYDDMIPVCCAGVRKLDDTTGEIKRVYARKNRTGTGTALMSMLEEKAVSLGYKRLVLECREGNRHAIEFYKKTGYTMCEKYPPYQEETDAVCLEKRLK